MTAILNSNLGNSNVRSVWQRSLTLSPLLVLLVASCGKPAIQPPLAPSESGEEVVLTSPPEISEVLPETVVYAKFQSDTQVIKPGGTFLLAVYLDIVGDYQISWTNPGDVGRATKVEFTGPPGFTIGPVQFPAPHRFERSDGAVSYGYIGETAVFAKVQAPKRLSSSKVYRFDVNADWVACKKECATEEISAWFEMVSQPNAPRPRLSRELRPHFEALPRDFATLPSAAHIWKNDQALLVEHHEQAQWVDFIPGDLDQPKLLGLKKTDKGLELRFEQSASRAIVGLLVTENEGEMAYYDVRMERPRR